VNAIEKSMIKVRRKTYAPKYVLQRQLYVMVPFCHELTVPLEKYVLRFAVVAPGIHSLQYSKMEAA
jgi:hypothetical protein